ncbi:MAG: phosphatidylserine/phosphatidylglycerophosphate/cardiolipin synthase family protein [Thermomicrobiales bacterium]
MTLLVGRAAKRLEGPPPNLQVMNSFHLLNRRTLATLVFLLCGCFLPLAAAAQPPPEPFSALMVLPEDGKEPFIREIDAATRSIDLYLYLLSDEQIIRALQRAQLRGVNVQVMLEPEPYGGAQIELETWQRLDTAGIDVRWSPGRFRFAHVKMMIVDERVLLVMNLNMTQSAFDENREFAMLTTDQVLINEATALFHADWHDDPDFRPTILITSPDNSRSAIGNLLESATVSIDIYAEALTDAAIIDTLLAAHERGVHIRLIVPELTGTSPEHEGPGFLARSGVMVGVLTSPYAHAKAIIVDQRLAFVGSQNLTGNSLDNNREVGVLLDDPMALLRLIAFFDRDFAVANRI